MILIVIKILTIILHNSQSNYQGKLMLRYILLAPQSYLAFLDFGASRWTDKDVWSSLMDDLLFALCDFALGTDGSVSPNALLIFVLFWFSKAIAYLFLNSYLYHDFNSG